MYRKIYFSFIITNLFFSRHFLTVSQPHNAFFYCQTLKDFIIVCIGFLSVLITVSLFLWLVEKFYQKYYERIAFALLYISLLPLLDFLFLTVVENIPAKSGISRMIYPLVVFAYTPLIVVISFKYQIEKIGKKIMPVFFCLSMLVLYYAIPRSFSKIIVEKPFVTRMKPPVHLIVFDAVSRKILNDPKLKHLFPNINIHFAENSYVFTDARSPGPSTIKSIPALLTGTTGYDGYCKEYLKLFGSKSKAPDIQEYLKQISQETTLFRFTNSYGYNNVLIGACLPYCDLFDKYLNYGRTYPHVARCFFLLPLPFNTLLHTKYRYHRDIFLNAFNKYISKINSSPQNTFFFVHFMIPREPFVFDSQGFVHQYWQIIFKGGFYNHRERYVKQLMFADKKLGEIINELKDKKLYDKSMIIITSDHDCPKFFSKGDMTKVPLFIKVPFQKTKHVVKDRVNTINLKGYLGEFLESNTINITKLKQ